MDADPVVLLAFEALRIASDVVDLYRGSRNLSARGPSKPTDVSFHGSPTSLKQILDQVSRTCCELHVTATTSDAESILNSGDVTGWEPWAHLLQKLNDQLALWVNDSSSKGYRGWRRVIPFKGRRLDISPTGSGDIQLKSNVNILKSMKVECERQQHRDLGPVENVKASKASSPVLSTTSQDVVQPEILSGEPHNARHHLHREARFDETGRWFCAQKRYKSWKTADGPLILWVQGQAGLGKSTLMSRVVDDCLGDEVLQPSFAHFYLASGKVQSAQDLLYSVYIQLNGTGLGISFGANGQQSVLTRRSSSDALSTALCQIFERQPPNHFFYIAIDGLDEENMTHPSYFDDALALLIRNRCKLLIMARAGPRAILPLAKVMLYHITTKNTMQDLKAALVNRLSQHANVLKVVEHSDESIQRIAEQIVDLTESRYFRCEAFLHQLQQAGGLDDVQRLLDRLASGSGDTFAAIDWSLTKRIQDCPTDANKSIIQRSLTWLCLATRPMLMYGLCEALTLASEDVSINNRMYEPEKFLTFETIARSCTGFIRADLISGTISLMNHDIQTRVPILWNSQLALRESELATACVTYLLLDNFADGPCETQEQFECRTRERPFFLYAACSWLVHSWNILRSGKDGRALLHLIRKFLSSPGHRAAAAQCLLWYQHNGAVSSDVFLENTKLARSMSELGYMVYLGLENLIDTTSGRQSPVAASNAHSQTESRESPKTPIQLPVENLENCTLRLTDSLVSRLDASNLTGHFTCALILSDEKAKDRYEHKTLLHAIDAYDVELLMDALGKHVGLSKAFGELDQDALTYAILKPEPNMDIIEAMIWRFVMPSRRGMTPLQAAIHIGRKDIVRRLLSGRRTADIYENSGFTPPIFSAISSGDTELVTMLCRFPNSITLLDENNESAICRAAKSGNLDIFDLVLGRHLYGPKGPWKIEALEMSSQYLKDKRTLCSLHIYIDALKSDRRERQPRLTQMPSHTDMQARSAWT